MNTNLVLIFTSLATSLFAFQTVLAQDEGEIRRQLSFPIRDIDAVKESVDKYTSDSPNTIVNEAGLPWLKRAVSKKAREEWLKSSNYWAGYGPETPAKAKVLNDAFDALAASAAKKLPNYLPAKKKILFHNAEDEAILKTGISDLGEAKIHDIGFSQKDWVIAKDSYQNPISRSKQGFIYVRYEKNSHPYCTFIRLDLTQQYAGGGNYGASFARYMFSELCGCPK